MRILSVILFLAFAVAVCGAACHFKADFDCKSAGCIHVDSSGEFMVDCRGTMDFNNPDKGTCIPLSLVNNGVNNCADGSDETLQGKEWQPEGEIMPQIMITGKHFYAEWQVDWIGCQNLCQATPKCKYWTWFQVPDGWIKHAKTHYQTGFYLDIMNLVDLGNARPAVGDFGARNFACFLKEENTGLIPIWQSTTYSGVKSTKCESDQFDCKYAGCMNPDAEECNGGNCIWKNFANNGVSNCKYGLDEGITVNCDGKRFCCESRIQGDQECQGRCIHENWIDDGEEDCKNGSDENQIRVILDENSSN